MEIIIEVAIQILGQILLQILFELGFRSLIEPFKKLPNPIWAFLGYVCLGAIAGSLSLLVSKEVFIKDSVLRTLNLMITPALAGLTMALLGRFREKKGLELIRLDKFTFGFAFTMALVRFFSLN